jgi:hypothetical protein
VNSNSNALLASELDSMTSDHDEACTAITIAKTRLPQLTVKGLGTYEQPPGRWLLIYEGAQFDRDRADFSPDNVATAIAFLRRCRRLRSPKANSYSLKHFAERWGERASMAPYITNGELIAAASFLDFPINPIPNSPNALIAVSVVDVMRLDPLIRSVSKKQPPLAAGAENKGSSHDAEIWAIPGRKKTE